MCDLLRHAVVGNLKILHVQRIDHLSVVVPNDHGRIHQRDSRHDLGRLWRRLLNRRSRLRRHHPGRGLSKDGGGRPNAEQNPESSNYPHFGSPFTRADYARTVSNSTQPGCQTLPTVPSLPTMVTRLSERIAMSSGHIKLKSQHAPKVPHEDPMFLQSTAARPLRILAEYLHPLVQLKKEGIADTIVMFGSARIEPRDVTQARVTRLKKMNTSKLSAEK